MPHKPNQDETIAPRLIDEVADAAIGGVTVKGVNLVWSAEDFARDYLEKSNFDIRSETNSRYSQEPQWGLQHRVRPLSVCRQLSRHVIDSDHRGTAMAMLRHNLEQLDMREIRSALGFSPEIISVVLDTSARTIERWEKSGIPTSTSVRTLEDVHKLKEIKDLGLLVYGDNFGQFLRTPMRALGGKSPQRALTGGDLDQVYDLLCRAYEGVGF